MTSTAIAMTATSLRDIVLLSVHVAAIEGDRAGDGGDGDVGGEEDDSEGGSDERVGELALDGAGDRARGGLGGVLGGAGEVAEQERLEQQQPDAECRDGGDLGAHERADSDAERGGEGGGEGG